MEKMTISEALDERDYIAKKVQKDIFNLRVATVRREKDKLLTNGQDEEVFKKNGAANYQSILDQIARYKRINVAIVLSNATTKIKLRSGREMTVAEAITLKSNIAKGVDLEDLLASKLTEQYNYAVRKYDDLDDKYNQQRRDLMEHLVSSSEKKSDDSDIDAVDKIVEGYKPVYVDALENKNGSLLDIVNTMNDERENIIKEINSAIKISNATTFVEF